MDTFLKVVGIVLGIVVAIILLPIALVILGIIVGFLIKLFTNISICGFLTILLIALIIYIIWG